MRTQCTGTGQRATYKHGNVHPFCPACGRDLSAQGKHQKVIRGIVGKHYVAA